MVLMENLRMKFFKVLLILASFFENASTTNDFQTDVKSLKLTLINLVAMKSKFKLPYNKFGYSIKRIVICGLSRSQKLALCHHILRRKPFKYEFSSDTYPYLSCHRMPIPMNRTPNIPAFKCPTPHRMLGKEMEVPIHSPISYYLSGAVYPVRTILYYQYVGHRVGIVPYSQFNSLMNVNFGQIAEIERNRSYISSISKNRLHHDVTPYYIQEWTNTVIRAPSYAEKQIIYLMQNVLKNNRPYSKFKMTLNSVNICGLGSACSRQICGHAFEGNEYNYDREILSNVRMKCTKVPITSVYINSRPIMTAVLYCGDKLVDQNRVKSFFLSTSTQENSILTYARYQPHNDILPEALISNIDLKALREPFQISKALLEIISKQHKKRKFKVSNLDGPIRKKGKITKP